MPSARTSCTQISAMIWSGAVAKTTHFIVIRSIRAGS